MPAYTHGCPQNRSGGLTAFDLLITLLLASILLLAGVPAARNISMNVQMKSALARLHGNLSLARAEAVNRNARILVCPSQETEACDSEGDWHYGWQVFEDGNDDRERQPGEHLFVQQPRTQNIRILGSGHRVRIRFFANGSAPGSNASFTFCDRRGAGSAMQLILSPSGRIRTLAPPDADGSACEA